jgi:hypothetical protein
MLKQITERYQGYKTPAYLESNRLTLDANGQAISEYTLMIKRLYLGEMTYA